MARTSITMDQRIKLRGLDPGQLEREVPVTNAFKEVIPPKISRKREQTKGYPNKHLEKEGGSLSGAAIGEKLC